MRGLLLIPVCFVALLVPVAVLAGGSENGFDGVVRTIETKYHVHATRIPFFGLISFVSRKATNGGVSNLHIAEFEYFSPVMDGDELNQMVETKLGAGLGTNHSRDQPQIGLHADRCQSRRRQYADPDFHTPRGRAYGALCA